MEFITLTTGATSLSLRSEVGDDIVRAIRKALAGSSELWAGWSAEVERGPGWATFIIRYQGMAMSQSFVCWEAEASDSLWELAEMLAPPRVVLHRPRGVPWLAAALLPGSVALVTTAPHVLLELADAERCIAWATIEEAGLRCPARL